MAKVEFVRLQQSKPVRSSSVMTKRVRGANGEIATVYTVDADSRTFSDDLTYVFKKNVKRAREGRKRLMENAVRDASKA